MFPSGEMSRHSTGLPVWISRVGAFKPKSQKRTTPSAPPERRTFPSWEKARALTHLSCRKRTAPSRTCAPAGSSSPYRSDAALAGGNAAASASTARNKLNSDVRRTDSILANCSLGCFQSAKRACAGAERLRVEPELAEHGDVEIAQWRVA